MIWRADTFGNCRSQDAATGYKPGLYAAIACACLSIVLVLIVDTKFYFENRAADRGEKELEHEEDVSPVLVEVRSPYNADHVSQEVRERGFRYTY